MTGSTGLPSQLPPRLPFAGIEELAGRPHVVVDGASRPGTVLALSHWPASPGPAELRRDLSAEMAFAYLAAPTHWSRAAEAVTNDHLDVDGLVSLYALTDPAGATARREQLVEVARVGDFDVARRVDAARVAFALRTLADPARSPLAGSPPARSAPPGWPPPGWPPADFPPAGSPVAGAAGSRVAWTTACYRLLLEVMPGLCDETERFSMLYEEEESALASSEAALVAGEAVIEDRCELDLAVVTAARTVGPFGTVGHGKRTIALHPAAIHGRTSASRVLVIEPGRCTYYDRYETWVRFVSRRLPLRVDLAPLAAELAERWPGVSWHADSPGAIQPVLAGDASGDLCPADLVGRFGDYLAAAAPAWDPTAERPLVAGLSAAAASTSGTSGRAAARWAGRRRRRP